MSDRLSSTLKTHSADIDRTIERFRNELNLLIAIAQAAVSHALITKLTLDDQKRVRRTPANVRTLRKLPALWQQALQDAGLDSLLQRYMSAFPAQVAAFRSVFDALNAEAKEKLPVPEFTKSDHRLFSSLALSAGAAVSAEVENAAHGAFTRIAMGSGLPFADLVEQIKKTTDVAKPRAEALADTQLMGFFRHVTSAAYDRIEKALGKELTYRYTNPVDAQTRTFCMALMRENRAYTKKQIQALDNQQGLDVWAYAGGWRCRGSWIVATI